MANKEVKTDKDVDQGYAWVILFAAFMLNFFMAGQFGCLGIFLVEYLHYFETSKAPITWIGSCQMFIGYFLGIVTGTIMKKFGCRVVSMVSSIMVFIGYMVSAFFPYLPVLYVFYGALAGIGFLNFYLTAMVVVQHYFKKKRAFATGVVMSGLSVGIFILPPLTRFLIDCYNWQGALMIEAAIFLNGIVFGALLRPKEKVESKPKPKRKRNISGKPLLQGGSISQGDSSSQGDSCNGDENSQSNNDETAVEKPRKSRWEFFKQMQCRKFIGFYIFLVGYFCIQLGHMTIYIYTPVKGDALGIDKSTVSLLVSLMGITGIFARPAVGLFGDCHFVNRTVLCGLSAALNGVVTMTSVFLVDFIPLAVYSCVFGILSSGYMALYGPALVDVVGLNNVEVTGGALMLSKGTANLVLHTLSGYIMDLTGNSNAPFLMFGACQALGGALIIPIPWIKSRLDRDVTDDMTVETIA